MSRQGLKFDKAGVMDIRLVVGGAVLLVALGAGGAVAIVDYNEKMEAADAAIRMHANMTRLAPARQLVIQRGEVLVHGSAKSEAMFGDSELHYLARGSARYSVDLRTLDDESMVYDERTDVLTLTVPPIAVDVSVDPRTKTKIGKLAFFSTEGGTGNKLEVEADNDLQIEAEKEARRKANMDAARKTARYEISDLYEDALRKKGANTRVVVVFADEAPRPQQPATKPAP